MTILAEKGRLEEETEFVNGILVYSIRQTDSAELSADFIQNMITLNVPETSMQNWAGTDQVGIDANLLLPNGNRLYLLLEKDFKCIDLEVTEDQSDYFENPLLTC